ncbi:MAG TPA: hypothetical protein VEA16_00465, partial [Vicinamibacterales bacterium]|nr:hypothetical protein [Vicinamibacterales bacterium]
MERLSTTPAPRLTTAETIAVALTMMLAIAALAGYVIDAAGFGVQPLAAAAAAVLAAGVVAWRLPCDHTVRRSDVFAWFGIVVFVGAMLLRLSWPHLVPPGRGSDLTHHLLLVDYIEQHGHLVHDRSLSGAMGEMAHYTPGSHLLAVMAGRWFGADGLRAFYPLIVLCAALAAGFVFLIARRILLPMPFAIAAVVLLCLPAPYFFGAFTQDAFLAQSVSTLFAVAMWWALVAWHDLRATAVAWVMALCLAATFLSWPVFVGPPLIVFLAMLSGANLPAPARWRHLAIVVVPWLALVLLHSWDRWGWMTIVSASGAVLRPSLDSVGWLVPILAATGAILAMSDIRARITGILLVVIGLQSL